MLQLFILKGVCVAPAHARGLLVLATLTVVCVAGQNFTGVGHRTLVVCRRAASLTVAAPDQYVWKKGEL